MRAELKFPNVRNSILISLFIATIITVFFVIRGEINNVKYGWVDVAMSMLYSFLVSSILFILDGIAMSWLFKKYPWDQMPIPRVLLELFFGLINAAFAAVAVSVMLYALFTWAYDNAPKPDEIFIDQIAIAAMINLFMILLFEGIYFFRQWRYSMLEAEISKRKQAESQYAALKNQVNPHFLFNSLNVLSALIDEAPEKAKDFIDRFSRIYRYILESHESGLSLVSDEISFLNDYFNLQKVRYNENISLDIRLEASTLQSYLPFLTLQLLVENAIKHNEVSREHPLKIEILEENGRILVKNRIKQRSREVESHGTGLKNLEERFSLLTEKEPEFRVEKGHFIVSIPLLNPETE